MRCRRRCCADTADRAGTCLCRLPQRLCRCFLAVLCGGWLIWLLLGVLRIARLACRSKANDRHDELGNVPPWAYRQPDPLIYSQQYLQSLGLAVTWSNPDIHVEAAAAPGSPVDSHSLQPDTDYLVVARIWNGSTTAPAPGLPVKVSYLSFGIGTTRHDVGMTSVDLPVKGAVGCPATAVVPWHTPAAPGHYCLQVDLLWDDDANPANNLGQHNTDVKPLNSPHAAFAVPLRNNTTERARVVLHTDAYRIPELTPCDERGRQDSPRARLERHEPAAWPLPPGWRVDVQPSEAVLAAGEQTTVIVDITAPDGFVGRQAINVHAEGGGELLGGVTLYVEGTG
jgi:hypothetical protein